MHTVAVNVVRYDHPWSVICDCITSVLAQDLDCYTVTVTENGSRDSIKDALLSVFGENPRFKYEDNGTNLGFAGAHNRFILQSAADIVVPLNPDTILTPGYLRSLTSVFADPRVGAATGKMVKPEPSADGSQLLDGTGIVMARMVIDGQSNSSSITGDFPLVSCDGVGKTNCSVSSRTTSGGVCGVIVLSLLLGR